MWVCFSDGRQWQAVAHESLAAARAGLAAALQRDQAAGRSVRPAAPMADPDQLYEVSAGGNLVGFYCLAAEHPSDWTGSWSHYDPPAERAGPARR
jgi:hypothetical protein